jgi:hypothetical protein
LSVLVLVAVGAISSACDLLPTDDKCAGVGYDALAVNIRDQFGQPQALGATVTLLDGSYMERDVSGVDPLTIRAASDRGGRTYDIRVAKPFYQDAVLNDIHAPDGGCVTGHERESVPRILDVGLTLLPDAPPIRAIYLVPKRVLLDRAPYNGRFAFAPYVDANYGVSHAVSWTIAGDTSSVTFNPLTGELGYRCLPKSGSVTLTARSLIDSTVSDTATIAVQGHPAAANDPPCA